MRNSQKWITFLGISFFFGFHLPVQALTTKENLNLALYESGGGYLGFLGGTAVGAVMGVAVGVVLPERQTCTAQPPETDCRDPMPIVGVSALTGAMLGGAIGAIAGQSLGLFRSAGDQKLKAPRFPVVAISLLGDMAGVAAAWGMIEIWNGGKGHGWKVPLALATGYSLAMAMPILWLNHVNPNVHPTVTWVNGQISSETLQIGLTGEFIRF